MHTAFAAGEHKFLLGDVLKILNSRVVVVSVSIKTRFELGIPNVLLTLLGTSPLPLPRQVRDYSLHAFQVLLLDSSYRTGPCPATTGTGKVALCGQTSCGLRGRSHASCGSMSLYVS